ncbi:MAG: large repetitive protein, partial [Pseudomonadota bacterium]|nr:large repetitive protein [Pseudomonadota bacterium]
MVLQNNRKNVFLFLATLGLAIGLTGNPQALADTFPPNWDGGAGAAVHHAPAAWPLEPANPADCGTACGDWKPYTRFQNSINDPRTQDPSNGGTAPQNYVNIASSCIDKDAPSIYYNLKKVDESDPTKDVIMFRWRVEQIANTYATGPGAGTYGATHPWSSALWTVLFDVDGSGYRSLAAHLNGSSGSPAAPIDMLAGIYGQLPVQSIDYDADPANIKLLGHNPTAFVDSGTGLILNFQNSVTPAASWPNGSAETVWDYGTTRALKVSTRSCTEYFIDYQIPVALLDATGHGGPKITRDTPIAMMFCTANSLNNPFQKDCAINRTWAADPGKPAPFGDYISFDQEQPYSQPIIRDVKAVAPLSCAPGQFYTLTAIVQDTLAVIGGEVLPSVTQVGFWYYHDVDGNGVSDDGSAWTFAANATRVAGTLNKWSASWDSSGAPKGRYLIGVQAVDNRLLVDDDMPPNPVDNRTFSYVTSNAMGEVYINGDTPAWKIDETTEFPLHSPGISPSTAQNWYGNPSVVGTQVAFAGFDVDVDKVDQALNVCGVAPGISKSADLSTVTVGNEVAFTITVTNPANNPSSFTLTELRDELPAGFVYKAGSSSGASTGDPAIGGQTLTWAANTVIVPGGSASLSFVAIAPMVTGAYSNTASALTSFSNERIVSEPVQITVGAARLSIGKTPNIYSSAPGGEIEYEIAFSNDSPVDATGAVITDILPVHLNYVADSCTGGCIWTAATRTLSWAVGNLAAGSGVSKVSFRAVVATPYTGPPSLQNTAAIDSDQTDPADATAAVYIDTPRPVLTISKTANRILVDPAAAAPGNQVVFTLDYANSGNADAGNVEISDPLPAGFTFVSATGGPSATPLAGQNGIVTWTFASLPAGTSGTVSVTAQVANPYTGIANPATNTASIKLGGVEMDSASVDVGVLLTGAQCTNYYLTDKQGYADTAETLLKNIATQDLTGLVAAQVSKVIGANAGTVEIARFYQDWPAAGTIDFSASASLSTFLDFTKVGNNLTVFVDVYAYDPADSTGDTSKVLIATGSANFTGNAKQTITTTIVPGALLPKNHKFLVVFSGRMNNQPQTATAYIGVNSATSSYLRLCSLPPANLVLSKTVDSALLNVTGSGRQLAYTLNYANTSGSQDATAALLEDILPTSGVTYQSCSVAGSHFIACGLNAGKVVFHDGLNGGVTIPAGASGTASVIVMVADDLSGIPSLVNIARIRSAQTGEQEATATTTITGEGSNEGGAPNVIIAKSANKTLLQPGDEVEYTLTVVNVGDKTATGIAVSDTLPATAYFTYKPGSISGGGSRDDSGNPLTWSIASLAPGARSDLRFSMQVAGSGVPAGLTPHDNTATLAYDGGGTATSNTVVATTTTNPILGLQKTASVPLAPATTFVPGDDIEYTLTVTNTGSGAATAVRVVDPIPLYARFNAITATPVGGASQFDAVNNRVVLDIASLEAGASATLKFKVVLNDALPAGSTSIPNAASASAGNSASATANATSTASAAPDLAISKSGPASIPYPAATLTAAAAGENTLFVSGTAGLEIGQLVKIGAIVTQVESFSAWTLTVADAITAPIDAMVAPAATFGITYRNIGNAAASGAVLTDALPAGFGYHSASPTADTNPGAGNSGNVVWNLGTLAPGVSGTVRLVAFPTGTTGELVNTAGIALNETDPDMANNSDEARVAVGGLTVRKSTSTPVRNPGGTARYTITISNSLSTAVGNISVSDILPAGFQYVAGTGQVNAVSTEPNGGGSAPVPTWTGLSVPASGSLTLEFDALIDANTGSATYQNDVETSGPVGVGITPFDPLATPAEDVTVIGNDLGLVDGVVFIDHNGNGIFDAGVDAVLSGIKVVVDDAQPNPYTVNTDENGYFSVIVPVGGYTVRVNDETLPPGAVALAQNSTNPTPVTVPAGGQVTDDTGFVTASGTTPDLAIAKTHTGNFAQGQSGATYTLTVSNAGSAATSGEVSVTDTLPSGLIATAISGDGWTCVLATLTCVRSDALAASLSYPILTLTVDVASDAPATVTNTASVSGGGESYTANNSASDETAILPTYTVTYDGNGSTGGTAPVDGSSPYEAGAPVTVLAVGDLVRDGYTFAGWNTAADGSGAAHASGAGFVMPAANVTLYAQWTLIPPPPTYTVTYDGNG